MLMLILRLPVLPEPKLHFDSDSLAHQRQTIIDSDYYLCGKRDGQAKWKTLPLPSLSSKKCVPKDPQALWVSLENRGFSLYSLSLSIATIAAHSPTLSGKERSCTCHELGSGKRKVGLGIGIGAGAGVGVGVGPVAMAIP